MKQERGFWGLTAALGVSVALLSGCSGESDADVPTTPRALAWLLDDHLRSDLGEPSSARVDQDAAEEFGGVSIGAEVSVGQQIVVAVGTDLPAPLYNCDGRGTANLDGCEETEDGVLMWEAEAPESDPGVIYLVVPKGDSEVLMFYSGPAVTGDPRDLDLPVAVESLFEFANDPRVDVTTTQEAVDGGAGLDYWEGADS